MSESKTTEPRGCPIPGACSALVEIERLRDLLREVYAVGLLPQVLKVKVWDATNG